MAGVVELAGSVRRLLLRGDDITAELRQLHAVAAGAEPRARDEAVSRLLEEVPLSDPRAAGWLSVSSGGLVEAGADPAIGFDLLLDALALGTGILAANRAALAASGGDLDALATSPPAGLPPEASAWLRAFPVHVVGLMARLARAAELRRRMQAHEPLARALRSLAEETSSDHLFYLTQVLGMYDGELLVAEVDRPRVRRYQASGIRNGFQLITLLEGHAETDRPITARRGWFTWPALEVEEGWLGGRRFLAKDLAFMLWGEPPVGTLPTYEGRLVALSTESALRRSWDGAFVAQLHPALESKVVLVEELEAGAGRSLLERIAEAARRSP